MANIRAEILAAGRSRKGWLDAKSQTLDQPFFKSIKSNFEDKTQENDKSIAKMKSDSLRPMGSKVSTIAHMFQTLSQQKTDSNLPKSPVNKDAPNVDLTITSDYNKYEKFPNALHSPISPQSSTCSLSRRGSHLARFNNAKAMFEKLEEKTKHTKHTSVADRKPPCNVIQNHTNKVHYKTSKDSILDKGQPLGALNVHVSSKDSLKSSDTCRQIFSFDNEHDLQDKRESPKEKVPDHSKKNLSHIKHFPLCQENQTFEYCSPYEHSRLSTGALKNSDSKLSASGQNKRHNYESLKLSETQIPDRNSSKVLNSVNENPQSLLMCVKPTNVAYSANEVSMSQDIAFEDLSSNKIKEFDKDTISTLPGFFNLDSCSDTHIPKEHCSLKNANSISKIHVEEVNILTNNAHTGFKSSSSSTLEYSSSRPQETQCLVLPNLPSASDHDNQEKSNNSKSMENQSINLVNESASCDTSSVKEFKSYNKLLKSNHDADEVALSFTMGLQKESSKSSIDSNEGSSEYFLYHDKFANVEEMGKFPDCEEIFVGHVSNSSIVDRSSLEESDRFISNDITFTESSKPIKVDSDNFMENSAVQENNYCQGSYLTSESILDKKCSQTLKQKNFVTHLEPNQISIPIKHETFIARDEPHSNSISTDDSGFRENSVSQPSSIDSGKRETNEYAVKDSTTTNLAVVCVTTLPCVTEKIDLESPPLPDPPSPCYIMGNNQDMEAMANSYSLTSSPKWNESIYNKNNKFFPKLSGNIHSTSPSDSQNLYHAAGESLAECSEPDLEFLGNSLDVDDADVNHMPSGKDLDLDYIEVMTQDEADKLLSGCNRHSLLSDEEAREVEILLSQKEDQHDKVTEQHILTKTIEASVIHNGFEYHFLNDGHYYYEHPGLDAVDDDVDIPPSSNSKSNRVKFSYKPIKVYSTYSTDDYDRRNEDIDPISASAEYELEKRIEKMDVFPVELFKGPEGLGLSIIGMGVGADAGVEKLGIFVKTVTELGAADKDGRIRVNDQIIEVDGKSLVGVTQGYAASVLRNTAGHVRFLIGRDKDGASSEIAQLINQSLLADKEREAERHAIEQHYADKSPWQMNNEMESSASTPEEENAGNLTYDVDSSGESASVDADVDTLRSKLKKAHYKNAVTDTELKKMKEKLHAVELMEHDYVKWLDVAQSQLEELSQNLQGAEQELLQSRHELENMKVQYSVLEKKYTKAKKFIKEFQRREQELIQQEEFHIQQLQEKDQEYNALVKTLKDRIILLEQTLNDVQRKAGLPVELPYNTSLKQLTPQLKRVPERPKFLKVHCPEMSDSEASDGDMQLMFSPDEVDDDHSKRATVERKPLREELFDKAVPHTELLDTSAAKSKAELANKGSLANRQPPSTKKQTGSSSTDDLTPDNNFSYDIFIRPSDNCINRCSSPLNADLNDPSIHSAFYDLQFDDSLDQHPLTLLEEMKVAVAARQARMSKSGLSDDPAENDETFVCNSEKLSPPCDIVSQSSMDSSSHDASLSYSTTSINEQLISPGDSTTPTSDDASPPSIVHRRENNTTENVERRQSNLWLFEPTHEWTSGQVGDWLKSLGFEHHIPQFTDADVTGQILLQIDSSRLKALGVLNSAERAVIKKKVKEMRSQLEKERRTQEKELKAREKLRKKAAAASKKLSI